MHSSVMMHPYNTGCVKLLLSNLKIILGRHGQGERAQQQLRRVHGCVIVIREEDLQTVSQSFFCFSTKAGTRAPELVCLKPMGAQRWPSVSRGPGKPAETS